MRRTTAAWLRVLHFIGAALVAEPLPGCLSGDAGQLPAGSISTSVSHGPSAAALDDPPRPNVTQQTVPARARARVHGEVS